MHYGDPILILTTQELSELLDIVYGKDRDIPQELRDRVIQFMDRRKYAKVTAIRI